MSNRQRRWFALSAFLGLAHCGTNNSSVPEPVASRHAQVLLPPQVSSDFAINDSKPILDVNATLSHATGSIGGGYLLVYGVNRSPNNGLRSPPFGSVYAPWLPMSELVFLQWNPVSGAPKPLARLPGAQGGHAVDVGNGWLVLVDDQAATSVLSRDGALTSPIRVPDPCCGSFAGLTNGGSSVLLTDFWGNGALIDLAGLPSSALQIPTPVPATRVIEPRTAFNGIDYLIAYRVVDISTATIGVYANPITPTGVFGATKLLVMPNLMGGNADPLGVVANGNQFLTLFAQSSGAFSYLIATEAADHSFTFGSERYLPGGPGSPNDGAARAITLNGRFVLLRTGSTGQTELIYPSSDPGLPDTVQPLTLPAPFNAGSVVITDSQSSDGTRLLLTNGRQATRLDASLQPIDTPPVELMKTLRRQFTPSFAFAGEHYLATWVEDGSDDSGPTAQTLGRRLSASGALLDAAPVQLSSQPRGLHPMTIGNPSFFAILANDYLADGARMTDGEPPTLTAIPAPRSPQSSMGAVTTDGTSLVAAFYDQAGFSLKLRKLGETGTWAEPLKLADSFIQPTSRIAVAFNAGQYVILWTTVGPPLQRVVYGVRVSADFELLDAEPNELLRYNCIVPNDEECRDDSGLQLVASGDHFLFAWSDVKDNTEALHVARLSKQLEMLDAGGVLVATQPLQYSLVSIRRFALGWDGSEHWVVWRDNEGGSRPGLASLRGRRFTDSLSPVDADSFLISNDLDEASEVTLAVGSGARSLVGYTRFQAADYSYRVRARFLSSAPFPDSVPCTDASQCQNGFCTSGFCSSSGSGAAGGGSSGASGSLGVAGSNDSLGGSSGTSGSLGGVAGSNDPLGGSSGTSGSLGGVAGSNDPLGGSSGTSGSLGGVAGSNDSLGGSSGTSGGMPNGGGGASGSVAGGSAGALAGNGPFVAGGGGGGEQPMANSGGTPAGDAGSTTMAEAGSGGEVTGEAGASEDGAGKGGTTMSGTAGRHGVAGAKTGGGSKDHGCNMRSVANSSPGSVATLAGLLSSLSWLRRRRHRRSKFLTRTSGPRATSH